jgi:osmoprotectant transport system substrate-binding protein
VRATHRRAMTRVAPWAIALAVVGVACTGGPPPGGGSALHDDAITVGSFDFPESELLGELYAQALERAGFEVRRAFDVGPRELLMPALQRGLVEVVPEYEGSALGFLGGRPSADAAEEHGALLDALAARGLTALEPARAQDRNAFVVTAGTAARLDLRSLSDLRTDAGTLHFGGPPECQDRPLCLAGLRDVYGLRFASFTPLDAGGPVTLQALREGFVDVGLLFSTAAALNGNEFVQLIDDRRLEPSERVVPVIRGDLTARFGPAATDALDAASASITTGDLREMNAAVAAGTPVAVVASRWLTDHVGSG